MPYILKGKCIYNAVTGKKVQCCSSVKNAHIALAIREKAMKGEKK